MYLSTIYLLLGVQGGLLVLALVYGVWAASRPRHSYSELERRLDDLGVTLERVLKVARREQMSRVRAAATEPSAELLPNPHPPRTSESKEELRRRVFGR